jgi:hypothetical protein
MNIRHISPATARLMLVALSSLPWCFSCGSDAEVAPVRGEIRVRGELLRNGRVMFVPRGGGKPALGEVDGNGQFVLTTFRPGDGAVVGQHRVNVMQFLPAESGGEEQRLVFRAPREKSWTVKSGAQNEFTVEVDSEWQEFSDD